jgi:hypothetical protein
MAVGGGVDGLGRDAHARPSGRPSPPAPRPPAPGRSGRGFAPLEAHDRLPEIRAQGRPGGEVRDERVGHSVAEILRGVSGRVGSGSAAGERMGGWSGVPRSAQHRREPDQQRQRRRGPAASRPFRPTAPGPIRGVVSGAKVWSRAGRAVADDVHQAYRRDEPVAQVGTVSMYRGSAQGRQRLAQLRATRVIAFSVTVVSQTASGAPASRRGARGAG